MKNMIELRTCDMLIQILSDYKKYFSKIKILSVLTFIKNKHVTTKDYVNVTDRKGERDSCEMKPQCL